MREVKIIKIGDYKIYYETHNYIVRNARKGKAKETSLPSYFTTLYGAINYISEIMLKSKIHPTTISNIEDLKTIIQTHNKIMVDHINELDVIVKNGIE